MDALKPRNDDLTDGEARAILELIDEAKRLVRLTNDSNLNGLRFALLELSMQNKKAMLQNGELGMIDGNPLFRNLLRRTNLDYIAEVNK